METVNISWIYLVEYLCLKTKKLLQRLAAFQLSKPSRGHFNISESRTRFKTMLRNYAVRFFHTTHPAYSNIANVMAKFLKKSSTNKKSKFYYNDPLPKLPSAHEITHTKYENSKMCQRRISVLNKVFMSHISDQMVNSSIASLIEGKGFEITRLKISSDFGFINIYWSSTKLLNDEKFEIELKHVAGILRHELSQLRVIGNVPKIIFIKDRNVTQLLELDKCLALADFGEDYTLNKVTDTLKAELTLNTVLDSKILKKIKEIDDKHIDTVNLDIPEMNHCVFGLNRENIMNKIMKGKDSSIYAWSNYNKDDTLEEDSGKKIISDINVLTTRTAMEKKSRRAEFESFIKNREIMRKKMIAEMKQNQQEIENSVNNFLVTDFEEQEDEEFEEHVNADDDFYINDIEVTK